MVLPLLVHKYPGTGVWRREQGMTGVDAVVELSIKLMANPDTDLGWVPRWLEERLPGRTRVYLLVRDEAKETWRVHSSAGSEWDDRRGEVINPRDLPCSVSDPVGSGYCLFDAGRNGATWVECPVLKAVGEEDEARKRAVCVPLHVHDYNPGFLVTIPGDSWLESPPDLEVVRGIARIIGAALVYKVGVLTSEKVVVAQGMTERWSGILAGLSHDLRTPLACIKGYATTLLREDVVWSSEEQREFLSVIEEETNFIENLITNLLDAAVLDEGKLELKREPVLLRQLTQKVIRDPSFHRKNHRFVVDFDDGFPPVNADPVRMEQVIRNLVDNAVKYSGNGSLIVIRGRVNGDEVVISVADEGIGISPENLNRLFERFFRIYHSGQPRAAGTGLGLPLARGVIQSHGGRIWAESTLGEGTVLYFSVPL